jgi:hypothetical protein
VLNTDSLFYSLGALVACMILRHSERVASNFKGTVIDIETIGEFSREFANDDSRQYRELEPTILGYITKDELNVFCAKSVSSLDALKEQIVKILPTIDRPLYAFQSKFERGVFYHSCGIKIEFDGELNKETFENKGFACSELEIPNYDDPFNNIGRDCNIAWIKGDYDGAMRHNRSCLLKERDILLKRKYRTPDILEFR